MEVRLEELFGHGGRDGVAPARGQGVEDHRRIEVALMVGRENRRAPEVVEMMQAVRVDTREHSSEGKDPGRKADPPQSRGQRRLIPQRKLEFLGGGDASRLRGIDRFGQRFEISDGSRLAEAAFVDGDLKRFLERHHQFDALERAQTELVDRGRGGHRASG